MTELHGYYLSVYTWIARLALLEKGVEYRTIEVDPFSEAGNPAHPFGKVPLLIHAGFRVYETSAITRYVDAAFTGPTLHPEDAQERACVDQIICIIDPVLSLKNASTAIGDSMFDVGEAVIAGDAALFVSATGNVDGPPLILLHGGLGSRMDFGPLARHLAKDHRLIAIDSRGHGRSGLGHASMSYRQLADDVATVLQQLNLDQAGIIGHSDGGIVALRLAASGLVRPRFIVAAAAHWQLQDDEPTREIYRGITADEWRGMFAPQVERYESENPDPDFPRLFEATKAMWLGKGADAYPGEAISAITAPLLVIHGDEDFLVSRRQAFELVERVQSGRLLNLPFASHTVLEDDPADVLPALTSFIAGVQRKARATG